MIHPPIISSIANNSRPCHQRNPLSLSLGSLCCVRAIYTTPHPTSSRSPQQHAPISLFVLHAHTYNNTRAHTARAAAARHFANKKRCSSPNTPCIRLCSASSSSSYLGRPLKHTTCLLDETRQDSGATPAHTHTHTPSIPPLAALGHSWPAGRGRGSKGLQRDLCTLFVCSLPTQLPLSLRPFSPTPAPALPALLCPLLAFLPTTPRLRCHTPPEHRNLFFTLPPISLLHHTIVGVSSTSLSRPTTSARVNLLVCAAPPPASSYASPTQTTPAATTQLLCFSFSLCSS